MKKLYAVLMSLCAIGLTIPSTGLAGKDGDKKGGKHQDTFAHYDANANGTLEKEEKDAILKDFGKKPDGRLKKYDTDNDGKLSDAELDAIKPGGKGKKNK